jgi:phosphinothricin acetyltransferase
MLIRAASLSDLPQINEIHTYYVLNSHMTFDVEPFSPEKLAEWFRDHSDNLRHRTLVAEEAVGRILGYACTGTFRSKQAYETTVEVGVACRHEATGKRIGSQLYQTLFASLENADVHRIVAGIAQPNAASNALHERFGFTRVGAFTQVGRKFGKYWDVLWMEKTMGR